MRHTANLCSTTINSKGMFTSVGQLYNKPHSSSRAVSSTRVGRAQKKAQALFLGLVNLSYHGWLRFMSFEGRHWCPVCTAKQVTTSKQSTNCKSVRISFD